MSKEEIEQIISSYFVNLAEMNPSAWVENFAPEAVVYDPVGNPPSKPHEDYQKFFELLSKTLEKLEISKDNVFICGNEAAVKWTMRVINKQGKSTVKEGISIFEIGDEGKLKKVSAYHYLDAPKTN